MFLFFHFAVVTLVQGPIGLDGPKGEPVSHIYDSISFTIFYFRVIQIKQSYAIAIAL